VLARLAVIQVGGQRAFEHSRFTRVGGDYVVEAVRGGIYTRWGTPLAVQDPSYDLGVYYARLADNDWRPVAAELTGADPAELAAIAESAIRRVERVRDAVRRHNNDETMRVREEYEYYPVACGLATETAVRIRAEPERFPGMVILENTRRSYPNGDLAPHVVGELARIDSNTAAWNGLRSRGLVWEPWLEGVGLTDVVGRYRRDDSLGLTGIERQYEDMLRGRHGHVIKRLSVGVLKVETRLEETPPRAGCDVYLTLREDFQRAANAALARAAADPAMDFEAGALVALEVETGAVLAAATWPTYDLASYRRDFLSLRENPRHPLVFRPTQAALPIGSVYKVVTAVAGLEKGVLAAGTTHECRGSQRFYGRSFTCLGHHGSLTLLEAIQKSCNVYFYNVGYRVGGQALADCGRMLGLGMPTGVDLPFARSGGIPARPAGRGVINLSIGQGDMLCTPLQVANMMAAIANGGTLHTPHFFDHAVGPDGERVVRYEGKSRRLDIGEETLRLVREGMVRVVTSGTARRADLSQFRAAGKTGSAETGRPGVLHAWFAGFAPAEKPRIAFAVVNEATSGHGGSHAAPIVADFLWDVWDEVEAMP